ncbi:relaxase/mobilization nuclease domain-containing protein [Campylobacter concisus]|uniref:relaxase/mobilization nuclease domain-containing protein n=1 Tax=Campylobacter concisus TaxID=199 RepID=UPI000CD8CE8B|nr:relaxase/mobilization nuclease domain-containing protein [Campylobacter concisus]
MLVKFLRTYTGGGLGSINYLLNERKAAGTARVIKGDENLTRAIIKGITYKQKTCFGVLSFEERHDFLTEEQKLKIIKDFEHALLGEYMLERTNVLWVEHSDKDGRLELNFLIPKIDLETDRSFNPYFAKYDQTRIDLIKKIINDEYGLSSPDDPAKEQTILSSKKNVNHYKNLEELDQKLHDLVKQGYIKNRDHMIELLGQQGIEVARSTSKSITIILPNQKTKNRLKGGIYDATFTSAQRLGELSQSSSRRIREFHDRNTQTECRENRRKLEELIAKRDRFNQKRYVERTSKSNISTPQGQIGDNLAVSGYLNNFGSSGWLDDKREEVRGRNGLDDTKTMEIQPTCCRQDPEGILHIDSKRRRDNREREQEIYINENGVEDDSIRGGIARRERALDEEDRRRKEQTRIRNNEFATRLREGALDITDKCDSANKESQELEQRLQRRLNGIFAATKRYVREFNILLGRKIRKFRRKIPKFERRTRELTDRVQETAKICSEFINEREYSQKASIYHHMGDVCKEKTQSLDMF